VCPAVGLDKDDFILAVPFNNLEAAETFLIISVLVFSVFWMILF
jgi:hypothetical protein